MQASAFLKVPGLLQYTAKIGNLWLQSSLITITSLNTIFQIPTVHIPCTKHLFTASLAGPGLWTTSYWKRNETWKLSACQDHRRVLGESQFPVPHWFPVTSPPTRLPCGRAVGLFVHAFIFKKVQVFSYPHVSCFPYSPTPHDDLPLIYASEFNAPSPSPKPSSCCLLSKGHLHNNLC